MRGNLVIKPVLARAVAESRKRSVTSIWWTTLIQLECRVCVKSGDEREGGGGDCGLVHT